MPYTSRDSIFWQMRLFSIGIALSTAMILVAIGYQSSNINGMLDEHAMMMGTEKKVDDFRDTIRDIEVLTITLAGTGNSGEEAIDRQIKLFAKVQEAGAMGAKLANSSPAYAKLIDPYQLSEDLENIAEQAVNIAPDSKALNENALIASIEMSTDKLFERIDRLTEQSQVRASNSRKRLSQAIINAIATTLFACSFNVIAALMLTRMMVQRIAKPARAIANATEALAHGNLDIEIPQSQLRELRAIGQALGKFRASAHRERRMAMEDLLSGLPNRRAFFAELAKRLANDDRPMLAYVDIDKFKSINDSKGHDTGDALIKAVGTELQRACGPDGFVARVGGDEFAVIVNLQSDETLGMVGHRLQEAFREPFHCGKFVIVATASIGLAALGEAIGGEADRDEAEVSVERLINRADLALYRAKLEGRDRYAIFTQAMADEQYISERLERDLAEAIRDTKQLSLRYQPIVAIDGEEMPEVEALARWRHPEMGDIPASLLIETAENCGLIRTLGKWVFERALADISAYPDLHVSINLSVNQLNCDQFAGELLASARKHGVEPRRVWLEITESKEIENSEPVLHTLRTLREMGFRIALDDFGTGYSSLAFLKNYPLDRIKLDMSLLHDLARDPGGDAVIDAAVAIATRFDLQIVAEGIETGDQAEQLRASGCTHLQGYYFAKPLHYEKLAEFFPKMRSRAECGDKDGTLAA